MTESYNLKFFIYPLECLYMYTYLDHTHHSASTLGSPVHVFMSPSQLDVFLL